MFPHNKISQERHLKFITSYQVIQGTICFHIVIQNDSLSTIGRTYEYIAKDTISIAILNVIIAITKFSNLIGYQLP